MKRLIVWTLTLAVSLVVVASASAQTPPPPPQPIPPQPVQGPSISFRVINEDGVGVSALGYPDPVVILWVRAGTPPQWYPISATWCTMGRRTTDLQDRQPNYPSSWLPSALLAQKRSNRAAASSLGQGCMDSNGFAAFDETFFGTELLKGYTYRLGILTPGYTTNRSSSQDYVAWTHEFLDDFGKEFVLGKDSHDAGTIVLKRAPVQMFYSRRDVVNDPASSGLLFRMNFWVKSAGTPGVPQTGLTQFRMTATTDGYGPNGPVRLTGYDGSFGLPQGVFGPFWVIIPYTDGLENGYTADILFQLLEGDVTVPWKSIGYDTISLPKW
ncbi:MAG: hypothetical protein HY545_01315 [Candidatus Doudnabacteria bacterium]|nr:hypothetical protein [Candidatus Doudnabacteria bacterium]